MTGPETGHHSADAAPSPGLFVSRAPGRVNLVGEHIDYHGLPVLPMALTRGISITFRPREDRRVVLRNTDPSHPELSFEVGADPSPGRSGDWANYPKAAARAVAEAYGLSRGIEGEVSSDLPEAAGLSSSSAMVVAVARALLHAADRSVGPLELAELLARGERLVGTAGGGMDQAASLCGVEGHALRIRFDPLRVDPVAIPTEWAVVVAHSGVRAEKGGAAQEAYNERRRRGGAALASLARRVSGRETSVGDLLGDHPLEELVEACRTLPEPGGAWAIHVLTEAARVQDAIAALGYGDLASFGTLLDASHASLRDVYGVSHPRLDTLVAAARGSGAAGARLTGAGFGGCILAVCRRDAAEAVRDGLARAQRALDPPVEAPPFVAEAGEGARVSAFRSSSR